MKKILWIDWYEFDNVSQSPPRNLTKYYITICILGKSINFRFMNQDGSFSFRCDNLLAWWLRFKWTHLTSKKNGENLPF